MNDFNGIAFGKYVIMIDRGTAVKAVQTKGLNYGGRKLWSKSEQALEARAIESTLFVAKKILEDWKFDRKNLWKDKEMNIFKWYQENGQPLSRRASQHCRVSNSIIDRSFLWHSRSLGPICSHF